MNSAVDLLCVSPVAMERESQERQKAIERVCVRERKSAREREKESEREREREMGGGGEGEGGEEGARREREGEREGGRERVSDSARANERERKRLSQQRCWKAARSTTKPHNLSAQLQDHPVNAPISTPSYTGEDGRIPTTPSSPACNKSKGGVL